MNKVKYWREKNNLTQNELADKSGLSLRTIQRIEAGSTLKGFSLHALAKALETNPQNLFPDETQSIERAKLINLSVLSGLVIPFGGIIFPLLLTSKTQDAFNKNIGKKIVEVQIIVTFLLSVSLIALPFFQKEFQIRKPLFLYVLIVFLIVKLAIVIYNGVALNKYSKISIALKNSFL
ncbi:helix-turn-helix domain-containing protein [Flavobacterium silvaticum]|uniref:Helix-turn-helix domain-containing protein n=1 Tax=Flavobacterium silvaticum TaxID=1852020 RepID=A0A972JJ08_9FLAO|nr:helix-turn-helix domain-containing protein [Flavobacterium silvaticum]NMH28858.1 helix-turn-helix domain-containing protein [Flavobacterium silvaticum]